MSICDRFQCISPFDLRRESAREVFLLVRRLNNYNSKTSTGENARIRKPAGDNWF